MAIARIVAGWAAVAVVALVGMSGCVTSAAEGDAMRADIRNLKQRLDDLDRRNVEAKGQTDRLRQVLDQATDLLTRNSADVGAKVQRNEQDIAMATGKVEEAKSLIAELQKKLGDTEGRLSSLETTQQKIIDRVAPSMPEDKESLWKEALARQAQGNRDDARRFLGSFIKRFPDDPRVPQARILMGQALMQDGKYTEAATQFSTIIEKFGKAPEVPEAMWNLGEAFAALKFCKDSQAVFDDLARRYPKSLRVNDAKKRVRDLQKILKDKKLCTS